MSRTELHSPMPVCARCACRTIIPTLVEKFNDTKVLVRSANMKVRRECIQKIPALASVGTWDGHNVCAHSCHRTRRGKQRAGRNSTAAGVQSVSMGVVQHGRWSAGTSRQCWSSACVSYTRCRIPVTATSGIRLTSLVRSVTQSLAYITHHITQVLKKLMAATSARAVLELLGTGMSHTSWRVREEVLNTLIMVRRDRHHVWNVCIGQVTAAGARM